MKIGRIAVLVGGIFGGASACSSYEPSPTATAPEQVGTTRSALSTVQLPSSTFSALPAPGTPGSLVRVTDATRGIWMDNGTNWVPTNGKVINVTEFGAPCGTGCDDGPAIQAAITALGSGGGTILFPSGLTFNLMTGINLDQSTGVELRGTNADQSTIVFSASSGSAITGRSSSGLRLSNLYIQYTNPSYTGNLLDFDGSTYHSDTGYLLIDNCTVSGGPASGIAHSLVYLKNTIISTIQRSRFMYGDVGIRGFDTGYANAIQIRDNAFRYQTTSSIRNAGESWLIESNTFEPRVDGSAGAYSQDATYYAYTPSFVSNWFGDANSNGTWVQTGPIIGLNFAANRLYGGATGLDVGKNTEGVTIQGNRWDVPQRIKFNLYVFGATVTGNDFGGAEGISGYGNVLDLHVEGNWGGHGVVTGSNIEGYADTSYVVGGMALGTLSGASLPSGISKAFIGRTDTGITPLVIQTRSDIPQGAILLVSGTTPTERVRVDNAGLTIGQGQGISRHLSGITTWNPGVVNSSSQVSTTVNVPNAAVGDTVAVGFSAPVAGGAILGGAVTSPGVVTVTLVNMSGAPMTFGSGTLRADAWQH